MFHKQVHPIKGDYSVKSRTGGLLPDFKDLLIPQHTNHMADIYPAKPHMAT